MIEAITNVLYNLIMAHPKLVLWGGIAWGFSSLLSSSLPAPDVVWSNGSPKGKRYWTYYTIYNLLHALALNWGRVTSWLRISPPQNPPKP